MYSQCVKFHGVWRSNVQERPWRSKRLPWNDLVCEFYMFIFDEFTWEVLKSYTIMFGLETSGKTSLRTIQGSLRKDPNLLSRLSQVGPKRRRHRRLVGQSTPRRWVSSVGTYYCEEGGPWQVSDPTNGWTGQSVCGQTVRRLSTVYGHVPACNFPAKLGVNL